MFGCFVAGISSHEAAEGDMTLDFSTTGGKVSASIVAAKEGRQYKYFNDYRIRNAPFFTFLWATTFPLGFDIKYPRAAPKSRGFQRRTASPAAAAAAPRPCLHVRCHKSSPRTLSEVPRRGGAATARLRVRFRQKVLLAHPHRLLRVDRGDDRRRDHVLRGVQAPGQGRRLRVARPGRPPRGRLQFPLGVPLHVAAQHDLLAEQRRHPAHAGVGSGSSSSASSASSERRSRRSRSASSAVWCSRRSPWSS
mmetsp:Transcript_17082/g.51862  ORF Transcript_17082/g.51862 Transcript_17082/m.51862 type:complete len:250 (-) Transcript_17082:790-1539(-)